MNFSSWVELKKCGIMMDDIIEIKRRDYSERSIKNRFACVSKYLHYFLYLFYILCRYLAYIYIYITEQPRIIYVTLSKC